MAEHEDSAELQDRAEPQVDDELEVRWLLQVPRLHEVLRLS